MLPWILKFFSILYIKTCNNLICIKLLILHLHIFYALIEKFYSWGEIILQDFTLELDRLKRKFTKALLYLVF